MAFSSQLLKAPSITSRPKLSKTSVSSSIFRGVKSPIGSSTTIKISKGMGYGGKAGTVDPKYLQPKTTSTDQTLAETNNILIEIQKQLAFDYASRIEDEKNAIKSIKAAESKRKFAAKEKSIEGVSKIGGAIGGTVSKIAAPIKGIFDKIKEFFGLILTGIVANAAFEWLKDENNVKTLGNIFTFIGKTLPFLLVGLLTYKLIKWGKRLFKFGRFFWRLPGRTINLFKRIGRALGIKGLKGPSAARQGAKVLTATQKSAQKKAELELAKKINDKGISAAGKIVRDPNTGIRTYVSATKSQADNLLKPNLFQKTKNLFGGLNNKLNEKLIQPIVDIVLRKLPPSVRTKVGSAVASKGIKRFLPFVNTIFSGYEAIERLMNGDLEGALISMAGAIPIAGWAALALDIYRSVDPKGYQKNIRFGLTAEQMDGLLVEGFAAVGENMGGVGLSRGGSVYGRGSGNVDSVSAMLAPGEEVIRTASARLFRPLLKDINDNAGRLWTAFSMGINKLLMVSKYQDDVNKEFSKVIEDQDRYQRNLKTKRLSEATGGGSRSPARFTPKTPKVTNVNVVPQSGGGMTFLPMVLPTQKSKPPQIPQMQSPATEAPNISSVNPGNPFMMLTPELYGIR